MMNSRCAAEDRHLESGYLRGAKILQKTPCEYCMKRRRVHYRTTASRLSAQKRVWPNSSAFLGVSRNYKYLIGSE